MCPMNLEKDVFRLEKSGFWQFKDFTIMQISDIQSDRGSICSQHVQCCDEIMYVVSGYCRQTVNNTELDMVPGDILVIREGDVHSHTVDPSQPARIFNIGIRANINENNGFAEVWNELHSYSSPLLLHEGRRVEKLFVSMFEEIVGNKFGWEYAVQLYIEQILLTVCRIMQKTYLPVYSPQSSEESQKRLLYSIINYMDAHLEEKNALKDMCEVLHYSYTYLSGFFKKTMGTSMSAYYQQKRFVYAAELLMKDQYSITEIARRMGYQTVHAFSKAFSNYYGICPTKYVADTRENSEKIGS